MMQLASMYARLLRVFALVANIHYLTGDTSVSLNLCVLLLKLILYHEYVLSQIKMITYIMLSTGPDRNHGRGCRQVWE